MYRYAIAAAAAAADIKTSVQGDVVSYYVIVEFYAIMTPSFQTDIIQFNVLVTWSYKIPIIVDKKSQLML